MITLEQVITLFDAAENLPSKPSFEDFPVYVITDVIDEDKTVKWNRTEIKKRMAAREAEVERLQAAKKAAIQNAHSQVLEYISQQTGLSHDKAEILWDFVVGNYRTYRTGLWDRLDEFINLYNRLK